MGSKRGLSRVYFVPVLSGMQLFRPVHEGPELNEALQHSKYGKLFAKDGELIPHA
jgi:hypothetical protein